MDAIVAEGLTRVHAPGRGVRGISLSVPRGECCAVLGANGSGKTTLARLLAGLDPADSGSLTVLGEPVPGRSRRRLRRCGIALDSAAHWEQLTARQNAWFVGRTYGLDETVLAERIAELFAEAGLAELADEPVETYSFGMRQKLALVEALLPDPELLILDEPTAGVDAAYLLALAERLRQRSRREQTTWLAGNDPAWSATVASRVVFLTAGRIAADGTVPEHLAAVGGLRELRACLAGFVRLPASADPAIRGFKQDGRDVTCLIGDDPAAVGRTIDWIISQGAELRSLEVREPTLADAMMLYAGRSEVEA